MSIANTQRDECEREVPSVFLHGILIQVLHFPGVDEHDTTRFSVNCSD